MKLQKRISITVIVVLATWLLIVLSNTSRREVPTAFVVDTSLVLVMLACLCTGLWRVLVGIALTSFLSVAITAGSVKGRPSDEMHALLFGVVMGGMLGYLWHDRPRHTKAHDASTYVNSSPGPKSESNRKM